MFTTDLDSQLFAKLPHLFHSKGLVFLNGNAAFTDFHFNTGGLGFLLIGVNGKTRHDDNKSANNKIKTVAIHSGTPEILTMPLKRLSELLVPDAC